MKIAIGCSIKFRHLAKRTFEELQSLGLEPLFPNLLHCEQNNDAAATKEEKMRLALEHYKAIDKADVVYLIAPRGYMGTSAKLELGYAISSKKPIYFSEPTHDPGLDCYVSGFIPTEAPSTFLNLELIK